MPKKEDKRQMYLRNAHTISSVTEAPLPASLVIRPIAFFSINPGRVKNEIEKELDSRKLSRSGMDIKKKLKNKSTEDI